MKMRLSLLMMLMVLLTINHVMAQNVVKRKAIVVKKEQPLEINKAFKNDIIIPAQFYMLAGVQNDLFVEPFIKRWKPFDEVVRFGGNGNYLRRLERVASIKNPVDGAKITLNLISLNNFDTLKTLQSTILVGKPGIGNDTVAVSIIGDSFTNGAFFKDAFLVQNYVPKVKLIGLRDVVDLKGQFDEGRGGWTLDKYFNVTTKPDDSYNGFWQPEGDFKYWGSTHFWKLANQIRLKPDSNYSSLDVYFVGRFNTQSQLFDSQTGYKINPQNNDVMFDNSLGYFVKYQNNKWNKVAYKDFVWSFNYAKYLMMWKLKAPQILAEFLGLNDFRDAADPAKINFTKWNAQLIALKNSYLKAVPNGKFVVMIPSSTCGILDNEAGDFTLKQNACMWELRKNIIQNFDKREKESIYVVDAGIAIDGLNGYNLSADSALTKPFASYIGTNIIKVQAKNPHPYANYATMGISLAAFVQRFREP